MLKGLKILDAIDFLQSEEFLRIKKLMGISDEDKKIFTLEISADDPDLKITGEGFFYRGRRVILYIRDQAQYGDKKTEYKFHITGCQTLDKMRKTNQYGKYVLSTKTDGIFIVNRIINNQGVESEEELHVCKHCLQKLNWKNYKYTDNDTKKYIYENFSIEEFFKIMDGDNSTDFDDIPADNEFSARLNVYPKNWNEISRRMKEKFKYTCQQCHKNFSRYERKTQLLEVHHKNGLKWDCRNENLEVLCQSCHQSKHNHKIH